MYFQTDISLQKHVVNGSKMGDFLDRHKINWPDFRDFPKKDAEQ